MERRIKGWHTGGSKTDRVMNPDKGVSGMVRSSQNEVRAGMFPDNG